jgi:hypothetical protein
MKEKLQENKIMIALISGFAMMLMKDLYSARVDGFEKMTAAFVLKEQYAIVTESTERRLSRIEQKIDELLKGSNKP